MIGWRTRDLVFGTGGRQSNLLQNKTIIYFILTCAMSLLTGHARAGDQLIRNFDAGSASTQSV